MRRIFFIALSFLIAASGITNAQFRRDSTAKKDSVYFVMHKDPLLSLGLSAVLPGAGQVYNGQWWKAPFIVGGIGACLYGAFIQNDRLHYTQDSISAQLFRGDTVLATRYQSLREFYRDDRDKFYIYAALVYVANLLDAYIAAHLFDFDVSDAGTIPFLSAPLSRDEPWRVGMHYRW